MRIGLAGLTGSVDKMVEQAERAEADGFASLWFPSGAAHDPLVAITLAARATSTLELGTAILPTYLCHPALLASRASAVAAAIAAPARFTLGIGPSHRPVIEEMLGLSYDRPGRHTEEYVQVLAPLLRGERVDFAGSEYRIKVTPPSPGIAEPQVLIAAMGARMLRVAGQHSAGTILWMANAVAIQEHVAPRIYSAAHDAGRPGPRILAGLPVAVHDDVDEARSAAAERFGAYGTLPNYQRILELGRIGSAAEAAIVGDEAAVTSQVTALFDAGATDVWLAPYAVGDDKALSRARTRVLLADLASR